MSNEYAIALFGLDADLAACSAPGYNLSYFYYEDFEASDGGYTLSGASPAPWEWGTPATWPGSCGERTNCWGTNLTDVYSSDADQILSSPVIDLSAVVTGTQVVARWYQANHIENFTYDQAYAEVSIDGGPWEVMWQNPDDAVAEGWRELSYDVSAAAGTNAQLRWRFTSDDIFNYPGLYIDRVTFADVSSCQPAAGGLLVGQVYDGNTAAALTGAMVAGEADSMMTVATPTDPNVDDSFYTIFVPAGSSVVTASLAGGYADHGETVNIADGTTTAQNFYLDAGWLTTHPTAIELAIDLGDSTTVPLTLTNNGNVPLDYTLTTMPANTWLETNPTAGSLGDNSNMLVDVNIDAGGLLMPGVYMASIQVEDDTPYSVPSIPVTLTVSCSNCGTVAGDITDDLTGEPIIASVQITGTNGFDFTVEGSSYSVSLLPGEYYLTIAATDYFSDTAVVNISTGVTSTQDFALTPIFAELIYSTAEIEEVMGIGDVVTNTVTVTNTGTSELTFDLSIFSSGGPTMLAVRPVATNPNNTAVDTRPITSNALSHENAGDLTSTPAERVDITTPMPTLTNFQWAASSAVLYDNGPLVNCAGCGADGADESVLQGSLGLNTLGFAHQVAFNNRVADEFEVTGSGWRLDTVTFFAYQTDSSTTSPITAVNVRLWDGPPSDPASNIIFGDDSTNRMISTGWSNIYRVTESGSGSTTNRPIMASVVDMEGLFLPAGTYWLDWQADGSLASGPWAPPISINGEDTTGNGLVFFQGAWQPLVDTVAATPQGLPFVIEGLTPAWAFATPNSGTVAAGETATFEVVFDTTDVVQVGTYTADLTFSGNFGNNVPTMPLTMVMVVTPGVEVNTAVDALSALAGETVTYTVHITNTGDLTDTFDISLSGETWDTTAPASITLAAGEHNVFDVAVMIPVDAEADDNDSVLVTATSQADDTVMDGVTLTTTAAIPAEYGAALSADVTMLTGTQGSTVTYTVSLENTGNVSSGFMLEVLSADWTTSLMTDTLVLDAGEVQTFEVYVTVPMTATAGEMDTAVIQATSAVGRLLNNQVDTIELTTTAEEPEPTEYTSYLPIVVRP